VFVARDIPGRTGPKGCHSLLQTGKIQSEAPFWSETTDALVCSRRARSESTARWRALKNYMTHASERIPLGGVEKFTALREPLLAVANSITQSPVDSHDKIEKVSGQSGIEKYVNIQR